MTFSELFSEIAQAEDERRSAAAAGGGPALSAAEHIRIWCTFFIVAMFVSFAISSFSCPVKCMENLCGPRGFLTGCYRDQARYAGPYMPRFGLPAIMGFVSFSPCLKI